MPKRHALSTFVLMLFLGLNFATSRSKPSGSTTGGPTPTLAPTTATATTIADLDPTALKTTLGCAGAKSDACRILDEFSAASKLDEVPAAGSTKIWMGQTFALGGSSNGKRQYFFLQVRQLPDRGLAPAPAKVPPADLLSTIGSARWLKPDNADEEKSSAALLTALRSGSAVPAKNAAADFIKKPAPPNDIHAMAKTTGASAVIIRNESPFAYVRRSGRKVIVIEYSGGELLDAAKAWCAEAWPLP